jgi:hypothetical protein
MLIQIALAAALSASTSPRPTPPALTDPGVSAELARLRAATLGNIAYEIRLDLRDTARARGSIDVTVTRTADAQDLIIDFRGPELTTVRATASR